MIGPALAWFAFTALAIVAAWWWLGAPVELPPSPLAAGQKLYCVSYAPFRGAQDPLVEGTRVEPWQIDEDLALLSKYTDCVRTYSIDDGLDNVLESARRHGLKVLHGVWISNNPAKTRRQIATSVALAKAYPDVIAAVVVGNEVLLRGEMSATDLIATLREVKAQVSMPVTYADVWEYWLRYPDVQNAVDFVTIHILPYWEDFPIPASRAAAHVAAIRSRVAAAIPNKEIVIGEFGWPSAGRMREGARPSPSNQARAIIETLTLAKRDNFRVNVIEAFDQPWKRALEGTVGGYWGIFDRTTGGPKFSFAGGGGFGPSALARPSLRGNPLGHADVRRCSHGRTRKGAFRVLVARGLPRWRFFPPFCSAGPSRRFRRKASASGAGCARSPSRRSRPPPQSFVPRGAPRADRGRASPRSLGAAASAMTASTGRSAVR